MKTNTSRSTGMKLPRSCGLSAAWVNLMRHACEPSHISPAKCS